MAALEVRDPEKLAFVTQTTLSVDDTADIVAALKARFPAIKGPHKEDICYATTNRQEAVKAMAAKAEAMLVVGAPNSSNSRRLVEVGAKAGGVYSADGAARGRYRLARAGRDPDDRRDRRCLGARGAGERGDRRPQGTLRRHRGNHRDGAENVEFKVPRVMREPA